MAGTLEEETLYVAEEHLDQTNPITRHLSRETWRVFRFLYLEQPRAAQSAQLTA